MSVTTTGNTGQDVGTFFANLGQGINSIIGGIGNSVNSTGNYNNAIANQANANAAATPEIIAAQREQQANEIKLVIFAFLVITFIPLLGAMYVSKKS